MLTEVQDQFLREHRWALVSTTGASGTPQVTLLAYHWDGESAIVSTRAATVKCRNIARNPRLAFTVTDDQRFLTVTGTAELVDSGDDLAALTARLRDSLSAEHAALLQRDIDTGLIAAGRVVIRMVPTNAYGRV